MRRAITIAACLCLSSLAGPLMAEPVLTQTHSVMIGGTGGPPDAADVAVLDLDGDGKMDIVAYDGDGITGDSPKADFLALLMGNGDGTFEAPVETDEVGFTLIGSQQDVRSRLMAGEFDGDGRLDLVLTHRNTQEVALIINAGDGTLAEPILYDTGSPVASLHAGDFDGDGKDDVLVLSKAGYVLTFLAGTGGGALAGPVSRAGVLTSTYEPLDFDVADVDGDGNLDAVIPYLIDEDGFDVNQAVGFLGVGDGTFHMDTPLSLETGPAVPNHPLYLQVADLDADGYQDVAVVNKDNIGSPSPTNVHVAFGSSNGWDAAIPYATSWESMTELAIADMDLDGRLDLVTLCDGPMGYEVLIGDGARGFAKQGLVDVTPAAGMFSVLPADVTGDGKPDLVLGTQYNGWLLVYRNDTPVISQPHFVRGDANDDGKSDISDPIAVLGYLFLGGEAPGCRDAADGNDDGAVDLSDGVGMLLALFGGAAPLPAPNPDCGADPTADEVDCGAFAACR